MRYRLGTVLQDEVSEKISKRDVPRGLQPETSHTNSTLEED